VEMAVKTAERAARSAGRRRRWRGELLPRRRHGGDAPPLSPLPSWLLGSPPPWRWDPRGRQKHVFGGCKFVGMGHSPRPRVSSFIWTLGFPSTVAVGRQYVERPDSDWA
jgi:hypothetical protein